MKAKTTMTEERKAVTEKLVNRKWFKLSEDEIQKELLELPEEFDGFLKDLGDRPDIIGNVEVLRMLNLNHGNYLVNPVFEVRSTLINEVFTYEYSSWKMGRETGCKGIVLIEVDNEIKYFLLKKSNKFPIARDIFEAIGTFYPQFSSGNVVSFSAKVEKQIKKLLELEDLQIKRYVDLGTLYPDAGLSNEMVTLFATVIEMPSDDHLKRYFEAKKFRALQMQYDIEVVPVLSLLEFVGKSDDAYFLSIVSRILALNLIKL